MSSSLAEDQYKGYWVSLTPPTAYYGDRDNPSHLWTCILYRFKLKQWDRTFTYTGSYADCQAWATQAFADIENKIDPLTGGSIQPIIAQP